jgi:hypothetical protein
MTDDDTMDVLTGVTLVAAFLGFFALCAMLVEWWNSTWRVAVEPVRSEVYGARMIPSFALLLSFLVVVVVIRVSRDIGAIICRGIRSVNDEPQCGSD